MKWLGSFGVLILSKKRVSTNHALGDKAAMSLNGRSATFAEGDGTEDTTL
jgi:hypothetical protein